MSETRQQIAILGDNKGFARALSKLLVGRVSIGEAVNSGPGDAHLVIWRFDGDLNVGHLRRTAMSVPTLVVADEDDLLAAVDAGARGFVPADAPLEQVQEAAKTILRGGSVVPPELLGTLLRYVVDRRRRDEVMDDLLDELTDREREVFELAASGARKDDIADELFISPATARTHLQRVYRKLGVHSQAELIAIQSRSQQLRASEEDK